MKVPYFRLAIERGKRDTLLKISASKLFNTHIMVLSNSAIGESQRVYKITCHPWNWVICEQHQPLNQYQIKKYIPLVTSETGELMITFIFK